MSPSPDAIGIHLVEHGSGPVVLLLHGISSSSAAFRSQMGGLGPRRTVAWDAPGYGRSPDPVDEPDMDGFADAVRGVIDRLGPGRIVLLGVSWGGVVATRVALRHGDRLDALVLADSNVGSGASMERAAAMRSRPAELAEHGVEHLAATRAPRLLSDDVPEQLLAHVRSTMVDAVRPSGYYAAARSMAATDHTADLARLDLPMLVVVGEHDRVTPLADAQHLARLVPGAELAIVPGAGHLANQEQPERFNETVRRFLAIHAPSDPDQRSPVEA